MEPVGGQEIFGFLQFRLIGESVELLRVIALGTAEEQQGHRPSGRLGHFDRSCDPIRLQAYHV